MELKGTITIKKNNGKSYYIHQYRDGNVVRNKSLSMEEAYALSFKLNHQKENELKEIEEHKFQTEVTFNSRLFSLLKKYRSFKHRYLFKDIQKFLYDDSAYGKVLALYGLRRTGKTTLIFQNIIEMNINDFAKTAYIKISRDNDFYQLIDDVRFLSDHGFRYIFIDEVTLLTDFISAASALSDIYGLMGKIILSGTDSLGFLFAGSDELYDRMIMLHTTYISYKEFSEVLGINSIDQYIEYGGLMTIEGEDYNQERLFSPNSINEYVDSAIAHNIEHSLKYYNDGDHFGSLYKLYEKKELTNVINRIVEDTNHRFAISVIEESFRSHDYGSLKNLIIKSKGNNIATSLNDVDEEKIINLLMEELSIINKEKQTNPIDEAVLMEVNAYLNLLDSCKDIEVVLVPSFQTIKRKVFIQPGLRYAQAKALLNILMNQDKVKQLPLYIRKYIEEKLLSDIKGKMLEEIVLYQTSIKNKETFMIMYPAGEIDMVCIDDKKEKSSIYEIKYSSEIHQNQYRHLKNEEYCDIIERAYYPIDSKVVLYRGNNQIVDNINYQNVEDYLKSL